MVAKEYYNANEMKTIMFLALVSILITNVSCSKNKEEILDSISPIIESVNPLSAREGTLVTITGKSLKRSVKENIILLDEMEINPVSTSVSKIQFVIPQDIEPGKYRISLKEGDEIISFSELIDVTEKTVIDDPDVLNYNYSLGTQAIGGNYSFTNDDVLIEKAKAIYNMGSNIIKISIKNDNNDYHSLKQLVSEDPSYSYVLDMPFTYYFFWADSHSKWGDGYSKEERINDSIQIAELSTYLLEKYNNSGKQFFLGHWEGDWYLLSGYDTERIPSDTRINGMIQWLKCRQNAVDEAKRNTPHNNVNVFSYCEVNRVVDAMKGKKRVVNKVLPYTNVDYVSYSSYDAQRLAKGEFFEVMDYIESNLPAKPGLGGKRVFIGEMGFKSVACNNSQFEHESRNRELFRKAMEWGAPFVLYWTFYNNEVKNGVQQGYWLIDDKNEKWLLYYFYLNFYQDAKEWVMSQKKSNGNLPSRKEYLNWADDYLLKYHP
jgi:hypothetical protein